MALTEAEKKHNRSVSIKKSKLNQDQKNISINGTLLNEFLRLKDKRSEELGFNVSIKQFFTIILNDYKRINCSEERS